MGGINSISLLLGDLNFDNKNNKYDVVLCNRICKEFGILKGMDFCYIYGVNKGLGNVYVILLVGIDRGLVKGGDEMKYLFLYGGWKF